MEQLTIVGTEGTRLVLVAESGTRFTLPIDDVLRAEIRKARLDRAGDSRTVQPNPRDVQAHIRAGLTTEEVAELLGARLEDVARFEGPVLAEREHIVGQALAVPVLMGVELEQDADTTFGMAIRAKLADVQATRERWTSWKETTGWIIKLEFMANDVDHDSRWSFDPRRSALAPLNADATQLSRQGAMPEGLIPRLRALDQVPQKDDSRFDSGAFGPRRLPDAEAEASGAPAPDSGQHAQSAAQDAAINRAPDSEVASTDTADLLEALRRRRGQREPRPGAAGAETDVAHAPVALFDALEPGFDELPRQEEPEAPAEEPHDDAPRRKGRAAMPSWDDIVFGARTDE